MAALHVVADLVVGLLQVAASNSRNENQSSNRETTNARPTNTKSNNVQRDRNIFNRPSSSIRFSATFPENSDLHQIWLNEWEPETFPRPKTNQAEPVGELAVLALDLAEADLDLQRLVARPVLIEGDKQT